MTKKPDNKPKPPKKQDLDIGFAIVIGAASFQAYQFGRALSIYDHDGWNVAGINIGGLILGALINTIIVLAATRLPSLTAAGLKPTGKVDKKTKEKNERKAQKADVQAKFSQRAFFGLMLLSPALIAPALYIAWITLPLHPALIIFLSIGWAVAPDLAIALGGFIAGKSLVSLGSDAGTKGSVAGSVAQRKPATLKDAGATESATVSVAPARIYQCECGQKFTDRFKYSGHTRTCATRKEIIASKDLIPVGTQTTIKAERK
jgi:hypothetical protein